MTADRARTVFEDAFFSGDETGRPFVTLGMRRRVQGPQYVVPFTPYTRTQRILHRLGIHRWHRHTRLTLARLEQLLRDNRRDR